MKAKYFHTPRNYFPGKAEDRQNQLPYPMKTSLLTLLATLLAAASVSAQIQPAVYVQLFMHCEEPHVPDTPNFKTMTALTAGNAASTGSYVYWRTQLKTYADMCAARGLKLNYQSDWNFLEGCWKFEIKTPLAGIKDNTGGLTIIQYLQSLGHECDPHSHQSSGYTYADVAFLLTKCGGTDTKVAGGHRLDPTTGEALDYAQLTAAGGVAPGTYTAAQTDPANRAPNWTPLLLMGGASASHENDPHYTGLWRPASATAYTSYASSSTAIPAIGHWNEDLREIGRLVRDLQSGVIPSAGKIWTASVHTNHRDIVDNTFLTTNIKATLDTLKSWQDAGGIRTTGFREVLDTIWPAQFGSTQHIHLPPDDHVSFSENWQDFYFKAQSAGYLERIMDLHESTGVPLDVFFTTWQTDIIADEYPDLMGRLISSALVSQGYHLRAPKPYDNGFEWGTLALTTGVTDAQRRGIIANYETYRLNPMTATNYTTAVPDTSSSGGFARLTALQGYAPVTVGALAATTPVNLTSIVNDYFHDPDDTATNGASGAKMLVEHSPPTNLNQRWSQPTSAGYTADAGMLYYRPEHFDWKLITLWDTTLPDYAPSQTLAQSMTAAHATSTSGGRAPWFIGIKLHDNDLFSTQSAWSLVWPNSNQSSWNLSRLNASLALSTATQQTRWLAYQAVVQDAAARYATRSIEVGNSMDTMSLQLHPVVRPVGLSLTKVDEEPAVGAQLAALSGGGILSGQAVRYSLVTGTGDTDNADFSIAGSSLRAARRLNYEAKAVRKLRVRWEWVDSQNAATVLASGDRALTIALRNVTTDDDDADGFTEADELTAGTNPADASSAFRPLSVTSAGGAVAISFNAVAGRTYTLQSSTDLQFWVNESDATAIVIATTGSAQTLRDLDPGAAVRKYYRIAISLTP